MKKYRQTIFLLLFFLLSVQIYSSLKIPDLLWMEEKRQEREADRDRNEKKKSAVYGAVLSKNGDKILKRYKRAAYPVKDLTECRTYTGRIFWKFLYGRKELETLKKKEQTVLKSPSRAPPYPDEHTV